MGGSGSKDRRFLTREEALRQIAEGGRGTRLWKTILDQGVPLVHPPLWDDVWWKHLTPRRRNILRAFGLGGELADLFAYNRLSIHQLASEWEAPYPLPVADIFPDLVKMVVRTRVGWKLRLAILLEAALFAHHGWRLHDCTRGHVYVAGYHHQVACPAHALAESMKRYRKKAAQKQWEVRS